LSPAAAEKRRSFRLYGGGRHYSLSSSPRSDLSLPRFLSHAYEVQLLLSHAYEVQLLLSRSREAQLRLMQELDDAATSHPLHLYAVVGVAAAAGVHDGAAEGAP
jgi:hypothetical protein